MSNPSLTKFGNLKIIKSAYILKQIFKFLMKEKKLNIIRYNKEIQFKLCLNIKDYKELFEQTIKIEIIFTRQKKLNKKNQNYFYYHTINEEKNSLNILNNMKKILKR